MNKLIIINYIKKLTKNDLYNLSIKYHIPITEEELNTIYYYIKTRYNDFLNGQEQELLEEFKYKVKLATYNKILELYNLYLTKYKKNIQ